MHLFIASCLLIVCGIVDANFYNQRAQSLNQLNERRQRSIGIPYPYGYHYNPIEPSTNVLDSLSETFDSRINMYKPTYDNVKMSIHDVNSVPRTHSYQPKNSLYDSEYISVQNIPSLLPENSYDYKYFALPLNKYLTQPLTTENDIAINLVAMKKTSVLGYEFPTYKSPYSLNSVLSSKYPNTFLAASQSAEMDPEISKVSSPTVIILQLLPETLQQESTTTTENPYNLIFKKLFKEKHSALKNSVEDESNHEITQETPIGFELNRITSKETQTLDESNVLELEENQTKDESNVLELEENQTKDESNVLELEQNQTKDESNVLELEENQTKDESSFITTEEESNSTTTEDESSFITTEYESNSITTEDESSFITTEDESNSITTENESSFITTEDESNSITTEESVTEDQSNSLVFEENSTEDQSNSIITEDESNSITTEENVTEDQSNTLVFEENLTVDHWNSITTEESVTEDQPNSITTLHKFSPDESENYSEEIDVYEDWN